MKSRCQQYEKREKCNFILNLEKEGGSQGKFYERITSNQEIASPPKKNFFSRKPFSITTLKRCYQNRHNSYTLQVLKLTECDSSLCDEELAEKEAYDTMKVMANIKSPGNQELTKECFLSFWDGIKDIYISSISAAVLREFSFSQRQAIFK